MSKIKHIFFLISLLYLTKSLNDDNDWDYKEHGSDWPSEFPNCGKGQQSPANILYSKAEKLGKSNFFYANLNIKKNMKKNATLELIENNNILSLSFQDLGYVLYNIKDPWSLDNSPNSQKLKYDEEDLQEAQCHNIMIKVPGEHTFGNTEFDGELQVNCTFQKESSTDLRGVYVSIPIKIENENNESQFSKILKNTLVEQKITIDNLPQEIEFDTIDIVDGFAMMDGVYYYEGQSNYPPCNVYSMWFYVSKPVSFSQAVIDQLKLCIDKDKCPNGNNRSPSDVRELYLYPQE